MIHREALSFAWDSSPGGYFGGQYPDCQTDILFRIAEIFPPLLNLSRPLIFPGQFIALVVHPDIDLRE